MFKDMKIPIITDEDLLRLKDVPLIVSDSVDGRVLYKIDNNSQIYIYEFTPPKEETNEGQ